MKNIIVAIDFSDLTPILIEKAKELASVFGSKLWLIHIAAPIEVEDDYDEEEDDLEPPGYVQFVRDSRAKVLRQEHQTLQKLANDIIAEGITADALLVQGPTVSTLKTEMKRLKAELMVIGAHYHGEMFERLFGSIWAELILESKTPLYVVPFGVNAK